MLFARLPFRSSYQTTWNHPKVNYIYKMHSIQISRKLSERKFISISIFIGNSRTLRNTYRLLYAAYCPMLWSIHQNSEMINGKWDMKKIGSSQTQTRWPMILKGYFINCDNTYLPNADNVFFYVFFFHLLLLEDLLFTVLLQNRKKKKKFAIGEKVDKDAKCTPNWTTRAGGIKIKEKNTCRSLFTTSKARKKVTAFSVRNDLLKRTFS